MSSRPRTESSEEGLLLARRLKELLDSTEAGSTPDTNRDVCSCQAEQQQGVAQDNY